MTLRELVESLQKDDYDKFFDLDVEVKFATGPADTGLDLLSVYLSDDKKTLWIDIGDEE